MNINVNNCEAFFLDYYEGNLSEGQVAELFAFLKLHAQMREAFESFANVSVNDEKISAPDFSFLKKDVVIDEHEQAEVWMVDFVENVISESDRSSLEEYFLRYPEKRSELELFRETIIPVDSVSEDFFALKKPVAVTADNFDYYAIASVEGSISAAEQTALSAFISAHPEYQQQLAAFKNTILNIDEREVFAEKSSLKKSSVDVNASNIESFLISRIEGVLSTQEEHAVDAFLKSQPEFQNDLHLLQLTISKPDANEFFKEKNSLKRGVVSITEANFEEMAVANAEGLLNGEERKALLAYVGNNSSRNEVVAGYLNTKVQPDLSVVFDDKEGLKRKDRGGFIWWTSGMRFAAAAVIVLVLAIYAFIKFGSGTSDLPSDNMANNSTLPQKNNVVVPESNEVVAPAPENSNAYASVDKTPTYNGNNTQHGHDVRPVNVVNQNAPSPEFTFIPARIAPRSIPNRGDDRVDFSGALYAVVYEPANTREEDRYLSPGQIAMRWMKGKLDGTDAEEKRNEQLVYETRDNNKQDNNVDGVDLTESAVNRVGLAAANGNVSMDQREDGTWLRLWKYNVRVGRGK